MTDDELSSVARALFNPLDGAGVSIGASRHFGSRIQPNSPGDDEQEILFSILEGLSFGCGDVIIGLNPAADDVETIVRLEQLLSQVVERLELPTRFCVLSDIVKQHEARKHTRVDVAFQSLAGTSRALVGMVGLDVDGLLDLARGFDRLYFETGQGSEVTNGAAEGVDMVTLEARTYGVARHLVRAIGDGRRSGGTVDDRERRRRLHRTGGVQDGRAARARVPRRRRDGEAARPDDGARRLRHVPHGHRAGGASPPHRAHRRSRGAGLPDGRGGQRRSDARVPHHVVSRTSRSEEPGRTAA